MGSLAHTPGGHTRADVAAASWRPSQRPATGWLRAS